MLFKRPSSWPVAFQFVPCGLLIDDDLQLIEPQQKYVPALLAACTDPRTLRESPELGYTSADQIDAFLKLCPGGHQPPSETACPTAPAYHFWMRSTRCELEIVGTIGLRVASTPEIDLYYGNIGYHVYPAARGNHYAERSCRLVLPLLARHGINPAWITCNPDNIASRRTCERLGAELIDTVPVPPENHLFLRGDRQKCRYKIATT